ncbi:toxin-activating lysine-acyltransferase [Pseudomonas sp. NPDC090233]|uniref:toxin-activating lysine-acyltransferase n=1 Tax=Pseudomonas sp. NPDC090233 TaxID=3364479 RepID=UPI00383AE14E
MKKHFELMSVCQDHKLKERAAALGYAVMVMSKCRRSSSFQIRTLHYWLAPAIEHEQIIFLYDRTATPIGFVIWAHLASDSEQRFLNDSDFLLHPSEWNEGGRTWIIDFCFPSGAIKESLKMLREHFLEAGIKRISWVRRWPDYTVRKVGGCNI